VIANAERSKAAGEYIAVAGIPVADQIARCLLPAAGLRELIGDSRIYGGKLEQVPGVNMDSRDARRRMAAFSPVGYVRVWLSLAASSCSGVRLKRN
jgi:hypothetical protein